MSSIKKVLMGTDGSVHASGAMLTASKLLRRRNLDVDVVCVAPTLPRNSRDAAHPAHRTLEERLANPAKRILDDAQRILSHAHLRTHGIMEHGSPADRLLALAPNYDLTVVGAYGNHDRKQPGLGVVSERLLQFSAANIMIGRELLNQDNFRVLAALDSSEASFSALQALVALLDRSILEVVLMHVIEIPWANPSATDSQETGVDTEELTEYRSALEKELRRTADATLRRASQQLEQWGIPATAIVEEGDPALELCSRAEEGGYDLVLAGATGVSDVKHALLGSVSLKLAWNAPCSVAIFRQGLE
jgi:nucleotide-binding universal stress UspA family protein